MLLAGVARLTERTACCAAAAGSTMRVTAVRRIATTTIPTTATAILAFALPSPESTGRKLMWTHRLPQKRCPIERSRPAQSPVCEWINRLQQTAVSRRALVGQTAAAGLNTCGGIFIGPFNSDSVL